jgi:hypothetical protein|tara:strand:- start:7137 stop:7724 length:588 start_codon:yes stop_codon:yes gene_type:complete
MEIKNEEILNHLGKMEAPIPGQSLTNNPDEPYPWEKPPTYTNLNEALYGLFDIMTDEEMYINIVTALGEGMPVTNLAQVFLEDGFKKGAWNPDLMLLLAEPTMYMLMSMAEKAGVKYKVDEEDDPDIEDASPEEVTGIFKGLANIAEGRIDDVKKEEVLPEEIIERIETIQVPESLLARPETEEPIETNSLLARG